MKRFNYKETVKSIIAMPVLGMAFEYVLAFFRVSFFFCNISVVLISRIFKTKTSFIFIGQMHSPHFQNFEKTLDQFLDGSEKTSIYINSHPNVYNISSDLGRLTVDRSAHLVFGNRPDWEESLYLDAKPKITRCYRFFIRTIFRLYRPDFLFIMEMQSAGYMIDHDLADIREKNPNMRVLVQAWGNDLYLWQGMEDHESRLKRLLINTDLLHCETKSEYEVASNLGFVGRFLQNSSISMNSMKELESNFSHMNAKNSKSVYLNIKGGYYLRSCLDVFLVQVEASPLFWKNKRVILVSSSAEERFQFKRVGDKYSLAFETLSQLDHNAYLQLQRNSKYHLTCNRSDGVPNSVAESSYLGAIPVFSDATGLTEYMDQHQRNYLTYNLGTVNFASFFKELDEFDGISEVLVDFNTMIKTGPWSEANFAKVFKGIFQDQVSKP